MTSQIPNTSPLVTQRYGYDDTVLGTTVVAESACGVVALIVSDDLAKPQQELKEAFLDRDFLPIVIRNFQNKITEALSTATVRRDFPTDLVKVARELRYLRDRSRWLKDTSSQPS